MFEKIKIETAKDVYEPAEDSCLLAKHAIKCRGRILEIGCGTGIVSLYCAAAHNQNDVEGVDINEKAVALARKNAKANGIKNARFYVSDLFSKTKGKYDWILFNAPYLPTEEYEKLKGKINFAFDGGRTGRDVIEKFVSLAPAHLKAGGGVLLIASSLSGISEICKKFAENGFNAEIIDEESFFFEKLCVIKACLFNISQSK
ncbi:MAG: class I SAM-dependent methyltransferase [Candidatus Bilamarchaeaceae archaeon]